MRRIAIGMLLATGLAGCREAPPQALGTLEYDRITVPAPAAERIVALHVREGDRVEAGARLLTLERTRTQAQAEAVRAQVDVQREGLAELEAGARSEQLRAARANVQAAQAQARDAEAYYRRVEPLGRRQLVAAMEVDRARAAASAASAAVAAAQATVRDLEQGARRAQLQQAQAGVRAAQAQAEVQQVALDKLEATAPRGGRIDSLPYRLGDQAPVGAPLVVMLAGDAPYARIYVPEPLRTRVKVGDAIDVHVAGSERAYRGRVRMVRSEPAFTPYYALIGEDAARLSYLAEVELGSDARELPAGLPVRVEFAR